MTIPDYQTLMRPVLGLVLDQERPVKEVIRETAQFFRLSQEEREELIPSGRVSILGSRVHWAITYMVQAGLLIRPKRAHAVATDRGRNVFRQYTHKVDNSVLEQFAEFREFKKRSRKDPETSQSSRSNDSEFAGEDNALDRATPVERIEAAWSEMTSALRKDLLARIIGASPEFFEHVIIDLMLSMGYGGSGSGRHLGKSADGGVDGVINEDPLGLDIVFLQAKRYAPGNAISVAQIREFAGSLDERGAVKGVFVTTSHFAAPAREYAARSPKRLILIDGDELTRLLVRYGVGVRSFHTIELRRLDEDYFAQPEAE